MSHRHTPEEAHVCNARGRAKSQVHHCPEAAERDVCSFTQETRVIRRANIDPGLGGRGTGAAAREAARTRGHRQAVVGPRQRDGTGAIARRILESASAQHPTKPAVPSALTGGAFELRPSTRSSHAAPLMRRDQAPLAGLICRSHIHGTHGQAHNKPMPCPYRNHSHAVPAPVRRKHRLRHVSGTREDCCHHPEDCYHPSRAPAVVWHRLGRLYSPAV